MAEYCYVYAPKKLVDFFDRIKDINVPTRVTHEWLQALGYKSKYDRQFIGVLSFLKFTDNSGVPTERWADFRGKSGEVLAKSLKEAYSDLYAYYEDAHKRSDNELMSFFNTKSKANKDTIGRMVNTFKTFAGMASFDTYGINKVGNTGYNSNGGTTISQIDQTGINLDTSLAAGNSFIPSIHIDLQIHISPEASPEQIEKLFECMSRHIIQK